MQPYLNCFFFFFSLMHSEKKRSRTSGKWEPGNREGYSLKDNLFGFNCKIYYLTSWFNMSLLAIMLAAASVSDSCSVLLAWVSSRGSFDLLA